MAFKIEAFTIGDVYALFLVWSYMFLLTLRLALNAVFIQIDANAYHIRVLHARRLDIDQSYTTCLVRLDYVIQ